MCSLHIIIIVQNTIYICNIRGCNLERMSKSDVPTYNMEGNCDSGNDILHSNNMYKYTKLL